MDRLPLGQEGAPDSPLGLAAAFSGGGCPPARSWGSRPGLALRLADSGGYSSPASLSPVPAPRPLAPPRFPPSRLRRVAAAVGFSSGWTRPERDSFVECRPAGRWTSPFRTFWIPPGQLLPSPSLSVAWHATPQTLLALTVRGHQPGRRALALQRQFFCVARRPCRAILPPSRGWAVPGPGPERSWGARAPAPRLAAGGAAGRSREPDAVRAEDCFLGRPPPRGAPRQHLGSAAGSSPRRLPLHTPAQCRVSPQECCRRSRRVCSLRGESLRPAEGPPGGQGARGSPSVSQLRLQHLRETERPSPASWAAFCAAPRPLRGGWRPCSSQCSWRGDLSRRGVQCELGSPVERPRPLPPSTLGQPARFWAPPGSGRVCQERGPGGGRMRVRFFLLQLPEGPGSVPPRPSSALWDFRGGSNALL